MQLKSYYKAVQGINIIGTVQIRLSTEDPPLPPFTFLGDISHSEEDDDLAPSIGHVLYHHVQNQLYLIYKVTDMARIIIEYSKDDEPLPNQVSYQGAVVNHNGTPVVAS